MERTLRLGGIFKNAPHHAKAAQAHPRAARFEGRETGSKRGGRAHACIAAAQAETDADGELKQQARKNEGEEQACAHCRNVVSGACGRVNTR